MDKGRFESAQRFYRRAIAIDPNDAGAHAMRIWEDTITLGGFFRKPSNNIARPLELILAGISLEWNWPRHTG